MSNPFEQLADRQMVAATKAKHKAAETRVRKREVKVVQSEADAPMKLSDMEQKQADQSTQLRAYRRWKREEIKSLLEPHDGWRELSRIMRGLTIEQAEALVDLVRAATWLRGADLKTRQVALSVIADVIIRLRISNGYPPMDDSLPGEALTVFEIIRNELRVVT